MRKFKNNVSEGWLFKQELRFFRNFMRNWDRDVDDCDFFDIFANSNNTDGNETKTMLKRHFSLEELGRCNGICAECESSKDGEKRKIVDIEVRRNVDDVIRDLWNMGKPQRARCREMLAEWCDELEWRKSRLCKRKDPMEDRIAEVCRVLKLDAAAAQYVLSSKVVTAICWRGSSIKNNRRMTPCRGNTTVSSRTSMAASCDK